ncbi:MAG: ribosome-associated translation inhibitor RaiA [Acidiferrobacterales bacterium]
MQITVSGQQMMITEPLRDYASAKIGKIQRHFDHVTTTNVVLHVEKNRYKAEATIHAKGATLHANAKGESMYAAIDFLADKLDRQVHKHKEKTTRNHHRNSRSIKNLKGA